MIVSMFSSYVASTGMTFRKPCGSSQSDVCGNLVIVPSLPPWFSLAVGERECILVEHGSVFTRRTDLRRNPQTLFRCQGTTSLFSHTSEKTERGGAFIPFPKGQGVFLRRPDNAPATYRLNVSCTF